MQNGRQLEEKIDKLFRFLEHSTHWDTSPWHSNKTEFMEYE